MLCCAADLSVVPHEVIEAGPPHCIADRAAQDLLPIVIKGADLHAQTHMHENWQQRQDQLPIPVTLLRGAEEVVEACDIILQCSQLQGTRVQSACFDEYQCIISVAETGVWHLARPHPQAVCSPRSRSLRARVVCLFLDVSDASGLLLPRMRQMRLPCLVSSVQHVSAAGEVSWEAVCYLILARPTALLLLQRIPTISRQEAAALPARRQMHSALAAVVGTLWFLLGHGSLRGWV